MYLWFSFSSSSFPPRVFGFTVRLLTILVFWEGRETGGPPASEGLTSPVVSRVKQQGMYRLLRMHIYEMGFLCLAHWDKKRNNGICF